MNANVFNSAEVVRYYSESSQLTRCERYILETYVRPNSRILDLGVGGGRTTPLLSARASKYVGVDIAERMVLACRDRFPSLEFIVADASDLSMFASDSFDAVVFSYNGIDYLYPDASRTRCIAECYRVLASEGIFIFSSHNSRALYHVPNLRGLNPLQVGKAVAVSAQSSLARLARRARTRAFWTGAGYILDPAHGGLTTYIATPETVIHTVQAIGLQTVEVLENSYPDRKGRHGTNWYYYVFRKTSTLGLSGDVR